METNRGGPIYNGGARASRRNNKLTQKDWPSKYPALTQHHSGAVRLGDLLDDDAEWNQIVNSMATQNSNITSTINTSMGHRFFKNHKKGTPVKVRRYQRPSLKPVGKKKLPVKDKLTNSDIVPSQKHDMEGKWRVRARYNDLVEPLHIWEEKVVKVLHVMRCQELTEINPKINISVPTRFCDFNIAFFDLDKESEVDHPLLSKIPRSKYYMLDDSVNVISIQIAKSDVPDLLHIYGTVLARDQNDYRCIYLFKRGRDEPQLITGQNRMLALTGPYRALGGSCFMYFEFNLKIKGKGAVDQDFSKGLLVRNISGDTPYEPRTLWLESYLSTVNLVYLHVPQALEASVGVNYLNGQTDFTGKISAWTTGNDGGDIILYDSEVAGTETKLGSGGSVSLSRSILSVPLDEDLVLNFSVYEGNHNPKCLELVLRHGVGVLTGMLGPYELQVNIIWRGVVRKHRPKMWKYIGNTLVLWG